MRKKVWFTAAIVFLLLSLYALGVLFADLLVTDSLTVYAGVILALVTVLTVACTALCVAGFFRHRIGRFNLDIFATIALFFTFMCAFLVPSAAVSHLAVLGDWFWIFSKVVKVMGLNSIGIYEATLFLAMLCCGFTIGEDKNRKYYE